MGGVGEVKYWYVHQSLQQAVEYGRMKQMVKWELWSGARLYEKIYSLKEKQDKSNNISVLPISDKVDLILAVSNSGIVYASDPNIMYYNFSTQKSSKLFGNQGYAYKYTPFGSNGSFYVVDDSVSKKSHNKSGNTPAEYYTAIFSVDIDGTNKKEVFVEEANYNFSNLKAYNGWIYYISEVPVVQNYGIDYYAGALYCVRTDGTGRQRLTEEEHISGNFSISSEGISYEYGSDAKKGFLRFSDIK